MISIINTQIIIYFWELDWISYINIIKEICKRKSGAGYNVASDSPADVPKSFHCVHDRSDATLVCKSPIPTTCKKLNTILYRFSLLIAAPIHDPTTTVCGVCKITAVNLPGIFQWVIPTPWPETPRRARALGTHGHHHLHIPTHVTQHNDLENKYCWSFIVTVSKSWNSLPKTVWEYLYWNDYSSSGRCLTAFSSRVIRDGVFQWCQGAEKLIDKMLHSASNVKTGQGKEVLDHQLPEKSVVDLSLVKCGKKAQWIEKVVEKAHWILTFVHRGPIVGMAAGAEPSAGSSL